MVAAKGLNDRRKKKQIHIRFYGKIAKNNTRGDIGLYLKYILAIINPLIVAKIHRETLIRKNVIMTVAINFINI